MCPPCPTARRLSAGIEKLEERVVLSTSSGIILPIWFEQLSSSTAGDLGGFSIEGSTERIEWKNHLLDVYVDEWIVQLDWELAAELTSVSQAVNLFSTEKVGFEILGGLGMGGQLLIRTTDVSFDKADAWFSDNKAITYFEPNAVLPVEQLPNDSDFSQLWGLNNTGQTGGTADADIDAPEAWDITTGDSLAVVAVIDTGVDYTHPDLAANIWTNPGEIAGNGIDDDGNGFIDDIHGFDFVNNDGDPMDDNSHGTHVAGTIAGDGNNGAGVAGVTWNSSIMALKFLSAGGSGSIADAVRAVNYATMMKTIYGVNVKLTSNSWGGGGYSQAMYDAIAASGVADILFIAAAGNSSNNNDVNPSYPSNYNLDNVIAVAATDHNDDLAYFSSYGATSVDLAAPGVSIYSTVLDGGYASYSGTSMATPHVSGVAALAWSVNPEASAAQVKAAILAGVDPLAPLAGVVATGGRLNALSTLEIMGMSVAGSSIAEGAVLTTPPTVAPIDFTYDYAAASIDASDLTVNGITADSYVLIDSDTVRFQFTSSPVTMQGAQVMQIASGAIARAGSSELINAWQRNFFYDVATLTVVSTSPSDGDVLKSAPAYIEVNFSEAIDVDTVGVGDVTLSAGVVNGTVLVDADTVLYLVTGLVSEGQVTYTIQQGAISDVYGSPGSSFTGAFVIDNHLVERFLSTDTPKPLIDNGTIYSTLTIGEGFTIVDLDVELDISHTWDSDLYIYLYAPDGTSIELFGGVGGSGENFVGTALDDEASLAITSGAAPFTGRFRPQQPLSAFDGMNTAGTWTLQVSDTWDWDTGTLNSWSLVVEHVGMSVAGSDPAPDVVTADAITEYTIDFTYNFDPSTVDASDLTVN